MELEDLLDNIMQTNLLLDFITKLNNAKRWRYKSIDIDNSNLNITLIKIFYKLGILKGFHYINKETIEVLLKYKRSRCVFKQIQLVSKPSKPIFVDLIGLQRLKDKSNTSFYILSTTDGILFDYECFYKKLSGKILLKIVL